MPLTVSFVCMIDNCYCKKTLIKTNTDPIRPENLWEKPKAYPPAPKWCSRIVHQSKGGKLNKNLTKYPNQVVKPSKNGK